MIFLQHCNTLLFIVGNVIFRIEKKDFEMIPNDLERRDKHPGHKF